MPSGTSNPVGSNGTINGAGSGGITNAPFYGTPMQQMADPLHLFPSPTADNSAPSQLPNLGIDPRFYSGRMVGPQVGGGRWNNMAQQLAGARWVPNPQPMGQPAMPDKGGFQVGGGNSTARGATSSPQLPQWLAALQNNSRIF